jgi:biotin operon repressor
VKKRPGIKKKVLIHGDVYESVSEAGRQLGCSAANISKSIKAGRKGYSFIDEI